MEGAIEEVKDALSEDAEGAVLDSGIIGAAARVEHYEIAGYSVSIAIAKQLGESEVASLLTETLNEELNASKLVMNAAKGILKQALAEEGDDRNEKEKKPSTPKERKSAAKSLKDQEAAAKSR
jgi:ferritin-like metal-binding protein YciE